MKPWAKKLVNWKPVLISALCRRPIEDVPRLEAAYEEWAGPERTERIRAAPKQGLLTSPPERDVRPVTQFSGVCVDFKGKEQPYAAA